MCSEFEGLHRVYFGFPHLLKNDFGLETQGTTISDLKTLNAIPLQDWPSKRMLGEFLFHKLRTVRRLERVIDEIKRSPEKFQHEGTLIIFGDVCKSSWLKSVRTLMPGP